MALLPRLAHPRCPDHPPRGRLLPSSPPGAEARCCRQGRCFLLTASPRHRRQLSPEEAASTAVLSCCFCLSAAAVADRLLPWRVCCFVFLLFASAPAPRARSSSLPPCVLPPPSTHCLCFSSTPSERGRHPQAAPPPASGCRRRRPVPPPPPESPATRQLYLQAAAQCGQRCRHGRGVLASLALPAAPPTLPPPPADARQAIRHYSQGLPPAPPGATAAAAAV